MATYAIIDPSGKIVNLAEWDGVAEWSPPPGDSATPSDGTAVIGGIYSGGVFSPPAQS